MRIVYVATRKVRGEGDNPCTVAIASNESTARKLAQQDADFREDGELDWTPVTGVPGAAMADISRIDGPIHYTIWPWTVAE